MQDHNIKRIISLHKELGVSKATLYSYIRRKNFPFEKAIMIEHLTKSKIKAHDLRPDLFLPRIHDLSLRDKLISNFHQDKVADVFYMGVVSYIKNTQPALYVEFLYEIKNKTGGENFIQLQGEIENDDKQNKSNR